MRLQEVTKKNYFEQSILFITFILTSLVGILTPFLPNDYLTAIIALSLGIPIIIPAIHSPVKAVSATIILAIIPLTSLLKAVTGSRLAPLTFDLGILIVFILHAIKHTLFHSARIRISELLLFCFLSLALLQIFNPNVPSLQAGVEGFRKFAFMSIAFYLGINMVKSQEVRFFQKILMILSPIISIYGIKQFLTPSSIDYNLINLSTSSQITYLMGGQIRPFSTLPGPFHLGAYLVITSLLSLLIILLTRQAITRTILTTSFVIQIITLFLTRTKGNWVGLGVGIVTSILLLSKTKIAALQRLAFIAFFGAFVNIILITLLPDSRSQALIDAVTAVIMPSEAPTLLFRMDIWRQIIIPAILSKPLLGYGTSSAGEGLGNLYENTSSLYFPSHNLYFKIWLEMGLFGLVLFLAIVSMSLRCGLITLRYSKDINPGDRITLIWGIATISAFLTAGLVIPILDAYPVNYYFWFLLGVLAQSKRGIPNEPGNDSIS